MELRIDWKIFLLVFFVSAFALLDAEGLKQLFYGLLMLVVMGFVGLLIFSMGGGSPKEKGD